MAVEAQHLNLFPSRILSNRELMMNTVENGIVFGSTIGHGVMLPFSATTTQTMIPISSPANAAAIISDSGLTYAVPFSRKRSREVMNPPSLSSFPSSGQNQAANNQCGSFNFLGEDFSYQIQQQQMEIDRFIVQHTGRVRIEIEERRKRYAQRIAAAMEENIVKKLKAKEDEMEKIGKLNWALEERVRSLCVENQVWRDLAQTNEATANALRSNLEHVLAQVHDDLQPLRDGDAEVADDAQSWCDSNSEEMDRRTIAINRECIVASGRAGVIMSTSNGYMNRTCRSCGKEESCVLLLPCRHLCLCTVCGSSLHTCPVCNSIKTASVHVNLSS